MSAAWRTCGEAVLHDRLAAHLDAVPGLVRVAVDGADCLDPPKFTEALLERLRGLGRETHHIRASSFWHDASLRLEHGREDPESYLNWLDAGGLRREALDPAATGTYLPTLRDPVTNRSTREAPREIGDRGVLLVSGEFLLGLGLPFERTIRLTAPRAALERSTPPERHWTLAAHDEYAALTRPDDIADVVIRCDRRHPVVRGLAP